MRQAVSDAWVDFSTPLEGCVPRLYADILGLVTTGIGNLLDATDKAGKPLPAADAWRIVKPQVLRLPWTLPAGIPALATQVEAAWFAVRNDPKAAKLGWKYAIGIPANNIRLAMPDVEKLVLQKLEANDRELAAKFDNWDERPADAQMAAHSMSWAMGTGFTRKFPRFTASFQSGDYAKAAVECAISPAHGTVVQRNALNRRLLLAAARPDADPDALSWSPTH